MFNKIIHWSISNKLTVAVMTLGLPVIFQHVKTSGNKTFFKPIPVRILITEKELTAFEFIQKSVTYNESFVLSGAYDIMSSILVSGEEE